jgi:hypothetical protein
LVYALGLVVLPALHLATHQDDHAHGPSTAKVDWSKVRDPKTGRVNLDRLAVELGLTDTEHARAHSEKRAHQHGKHASTESARHGFGAAEHFSLAFLDTVDVPVLPHTLVAIATIPERIAPDAPPSRLLFLKAQRSQAPPV